MLDVLVVEDDPILLNASHAAGVEQGVIRLGVEISESDLVLRVDDSGPGLCATTTSDATTRMASTCGGLGLGLLIVRRVADEAGGGVAFSRSPTPGWRLRGTAASPGFPAAMITR